MSKADEPWAGKVLADRYRIVKSVGRGGMGTVYEALRLDDEQVVALKVLHRAHGNDERALARFAREAEALARLLHPNIVRVLGFSARPNEPAFLVLERLHGEPLSAVLHRRGTLSSAEVAVLSLAVLAALEAAHAAGIVHRDLKPDNIFLGASVAGEIAAADRPTVVDDRVKLLDFGIVKLLEGDGRDKLTATGTVLGTPTYMAPEQLAGEEIDGRTDLYSLGVVMYRAISGSPPFSGSWHELTQAVLHEPPPPLRDRQPTVDRRLAQVIEGALAKHRGGRPRSARAMMEMLTVIASSASGAGSPIDGDSPGASTGGAPEGDGQASRPPTTGTSPQSPRAMASQGEDDRDDGDQSR